MRIIVANMKATFNQFTANDHPSCLTFSASAKKEIFYNLRLYVHVSEYLFNLFVIYLVFCMFFFYLNAAADSASGICMCVCMTCICIIHMLTSFVLLFN